GRSARWVDRAGCSGARGGGGGGGRGGTGRGGRACRTGDLPARRGRSGAFGQRAIRGWRAAIFADGGPLERPGRADRGAARRTGRRAPRRGRAPSRWRRRVGRLAHWRGGAAVVRRGAILVEVILSVALFTM